MSHIHTITGSGIPLTGNDIDTDRIIPARFLRCVSFNGLGEQVFADDRHQAKGQHSFDLPEFQGASILVVNSNFGCGSSREHAPQAIAKWGIQAIIGESFAEIFFGNCVAIGLPCVTAMPAIVQQLQLQLVQHPDMPLQVDLERLMVTSDGVSASVMMGEGPRQMMLLGTWDACGQLLEQADPIKGTAERLPYLAWS